jgi:hypothetical protein
MFTRYYHEECRQGSIACSLLGRIGVLKLYVSIGGRFKGEVGILCLKRGVCNLVTTLVV